MIVLAMFTLNFFHPGRLLYPVKAEILSAYDASDSPQKTSSDETSAIAAEKPAQS